MYWRLVARFIMGALFLVPGLALSLGLGEIQVHSALNQPMNAEIEILDFDASELDEVDVELGSQEIFERVGVPRPFILTRLKFTPILSQGKPVIRITSTDPVPEPFLTFLIDLRWSQGQLLREYTVLLDPPVFGNQLPGGSVQKPVLEKKPPSVKAQKPAQVQPIQGPAPTLRTVSPQSTKPQTQTNFDSASNSTAPNAGDTVKVERGDTLWGISERFVGGSNLSVSQMMLAIQDVNPQAFSNNNINNLNSGAILRVPSQQAASSRSRSQAESEVRNQWKVWQKGQQLSDSSAVNVDSGSSDTAAVTEVAKSEDTSAEAKLSILGDQNVTEGTSGSDANASAVNELREQIALLKESITSKDEANKELSDRIASLDEILKKQESIIKLQNEQLAQLQNNAQLASENNTDTAAALQEEVNSLNQAAEQQLEESKSLLEEAQVDASGVTTIAKAHVEPLPDFSEPIPEEFLQAEAGLQTDEMTDASVAEKVSEASDTPKITITETEQTEQVSLIDKVIAFANEQRQNLIYAGGAILVAILAWFGLRRRQASHNAASLESSGMPVFVDDHAEDEIEETAVASSDSVDQALDDLEEVTEDSDKGFVDDEPTPTDNDEVLEEAEVYISYGLFQQAEDLLKQAIKNNPRNVAYQAKLAEVYHSENRTDEFIEFVSSNEKALKSSPSTWTKVSGFGAALAPAHALFNGGQSGDNVVDMGNSFASEESASKDEANHDLGDEIDDGSIDFSFAEDEEPSTSVADGELSQDDVDELIAPSSNEPSSTPQPMALDTGAEDSIELTDKADSVVDNVEEKLDHVEDLTENLAEQETLTGETIDEATLEFDTSALEDELISAPASSEVRSDVNDDIDLDFDSDLSLNTEEIDSGEIDLDIDLGEGNTDEETLIFDSSAISKDALELGDDVADGQDSEIETALFDSSLFEVSEINETEDLGDAEAETEMLSPDALADNDPVANEEDTVSIEQLQENLTAELETLSFDPSEMDSQIIEDNDDTASLATAEMNKGDFEIDIADQITQNLDIGELDTEFSDLGNLIDGDDDIDPPTVIEEVGTKLDLAKAFVDMGDQDAAKETLTEVLERGDMTQIREAKELLDKIT